MSLSPNDDVSSEPAATKATPLRTHDTALVLAGGNALGAYHAGAYEVLHSRGIRPDWVVGASMGAVTAAIIVGNAPEDRAGKLRQFWSPPPHG